MKSNNQISVVDSPALEILINLLSFIFLWLHSVLSQVNKGNFELSPWAWITRVTNFIITTFAYFQKWHAGKMTHGALGARYASENSGSDYSFGKGMTKTKVPLASCHRGKKFLLILDSTNVLSDLEHMTLGPNVHVHQVLIISFVFIDVAINCRLQEIET